MEGTKWLLITMCIALGFLAAQIEGAWFRRRFFRIRIPRPSPARKPLQKIETSLNSAGKNVRERVKKINEYLDSEAGGSQMEAVESSIVKISEAIPSLTSDDTAEIITGTIDVIAAMTSLIPTAGPIISTMFSFIGAIFGAIAGGGGRTEDVGTIVKREIENALRYHEDSELRADAAGTISLFSNAHAYLEGNDDNAEINDNDVLALSSHVSIDHGVEFIGKLEFKIEEYSESADYWKVEKAMEYLQLYVTLVTMRYSILWEFYSIARVPPNSRSIADRVKNVIDVADERVTKFLSFLQKADYSRAAFFAMFDASEWKATRTFMDKKGLKYTVQQNSNLVDIDRRDGFVFVKSAATYLDDRFMYMKGDRWGNIAGCSDGRDQAKFHIDEVPEYYNTFHLRSAKWPEWYVFMVNDRNGYCRGTKSTPGLNGRWKITKFHDGYYLLSTIDWPNKFIYMTSDGDVKVHDGDPGLTGHWDIF